MQPSDQLVLMRSFEKLIDLCHRHAIGFWLDAGTLLGAARHQNIIPWDFDVDIGMTERDYASLLALFARHDGTLGGLTLDALFYEEPASCCCIYEGEQSDLGIDVVAYAERNGMCATLMSRELQDAYPFQYDHPYDRIFPLRTVPFLGNTVAVPGQTERVLAAMYGPAFDAYPPAEYGEWRAMLSEEQAALRLGPPFRSVREAANVELGLAERRTPFVARGVAADFPAAERVRRALANEPSLYGYFEAPNEPFETKYRTPEDVLALWERDELDLNVVDSESNDASLTPAIIVRNVATALEGEDAKRLCSYVVTNKNTRTTLHVDPSFGGGWMFLYEGRKIWWLIAAEDAAHLERLGYGLEELRRRSFSELVHVADAYLWGKLQVAVCGKHDFIYFPEGCVHGVMTYERAFGLGGYV
ncbi:MAG TPA: LicD family protein [Polyangiaceae bacterium]|nr:LicD family protein [Polyangiaceae bacterium]